MSQHTPPSWHPDPSGCHELRFWDGTTWTDHVADQGRQGVDPLPPADRTRGVTQEVEVTTPEPFTPIAYSVEPSPAAAQAEPRMSRAEKKVKRQMERIGARSVAARTDSPLLTDQVLVVNQQARLRGANVSYAIHNQAGLRIGAVEEVGRGIVRRSTARVVGRPDSSRTYRLQVIDADGGVLFTMTRPDVVLKSKMTVRTLDGKTVGQIVQKTMGFFRKVHFDLEADGKAIGSINADNWSAWDFSILDKRGDEVARVTKTWAGWFKERFTQADNYVVEINRPLEEPLRTLVLAASLAVDIALKQGNNNGRAR